MEVKDKNIFSYLNDDEKILFIPSRKKFDFYYHALIFGGMLPLSFFFLYLTINQLNYLGSLWMSLLICLLLFILGLSIRDYFFTELILTNQRIIISRFGKFTLIENSLVKTITGTTSVKSLSFATILLKSSKKYKILFVNKDLLKNKFKEIYPEYDDSKVSYNVLPQYLFFIMVFIIVVILMSKM